MRPAVAGRLNGKQEAASRVSRWTKPLTVRWQRRLNADQRIALSTSNARRTSPAMAAPAVTSESAIAAAVERNA